MSQPKKIVILGHFGVGKTSLIRQFVESEFSEDYLVTVGVHVKKKDVTIDGDNVTLVIWDLEGTPEIKTARKSYLLGASGFIYVFDISRPETYDNLGVQMDYLKEHFPGIPSVIVGNKSDKFDTEISRSFFETEHFNQCLFTSAKTGDNVEKTFNILTKNILSNGHF